MKDDGAPFTGRSRFDALLKGEKPDDQKPDEGESFSDRCGLFGKYPQQGVVLEMENGDHIGVFYGSICSAIVFIPTLGIHFQFVDAGDIVKEVLVTGTNSEESLGFLRQLHRHLTQGKRETLHCRKPILTGIAINELKQEKPKREESED
jgi:hypothetical protein